jgi:hypothetical protein
VVVVAVSVTFKVDVTRGAADNSEGYRYRRNTFSIRGLIYITNRTTNYDLQYIYNVQKDSILKLRLACNY